MTRRSGAPRHFMMAMVRRRPTKKLSMALPTPTPPTSSEARPIRPMNWVNRSSQKRMPPPAPPAGIGKAAFERVDGGDIGRAGRQAQPVLPVQQAARLDEARFGHRVEGNHEPRAQAREGIQPAV